MDARRTFWMRWLGIAVWVVFLLGIGLILVAMLPKTDLDPVLPAFWPTGGMGEGAVRLYSWLLGAWGATLAGWAVTLIFLVKHAIMRGERWAWRAAMTGLLVWFPVDTGFSAWFRVWFNVWLNVILLFIVLTPLLGVQPEDA